MRSRHWSPVYALSIILRRAETASKQTLASRHAHTLLLITALAQQPHLPTIWYLAVGILLPMPLPVTHRVCVCNAAKQHRFPCAHVSKASEMRSQSSPLPPLCPDTAQAMDGASLSMFITKRLESSLGIYNPNLRCSCCQPSKASRVKRGKLHPCFSHLGKGMKIRVMWLCSDTFILPPSHVTELTPNNEGRSYTHESDFARAGKTFRFKMQNQLGRKPNIHRTPQGANSHP